ncbi:hypothetical protein MKW94_001659 [Papaver nudicaule]|uniref:Bet v I/Major latex protein domain-containing protein n=1 Tax=Papaver nudicaule TaxID=74823 RepID=A0AA41UXR3_PAPNU|nr:hypothetical protein [Papaver nudicaule]
MFTHDVEGLPEVLPRIISGTKVIEGNWVSTGCVKEWNYIIDGKPLSVKEKTTLVDDTTRTIVHSVFDGEIIEVYKKLDATLCVTPNATGHGCLVHWTIEYEKVNEDCPTPIAYLDLVDKMTKDLDSRLCSSA